MLTRATKNFLTSSKLKPPSNFQARAITNFPHQGLFKSSKNHYGTLRTGKTLEPSWLSLVCTCILCIPVCNIFLHAVLSNQTICLKNENKTQNNCTPISTYFYGPTGRRRSTWPCKNNNIMIIKNPSDPLQSYSQPYAYVIIIGCLHVMIGLYIRYVIYGIDLASDITPWATTPIQVSHSSGLTSILYYLKVLIKR